MRLQPYRLTRLAAIVLLTLSAASSPCTGPASAQPVVTPPAPRQLVTEPMTWLVRTDYAWTPVEQAQPTIWVEGQPVTRMVVEKPGMEKRLSVAP